MNEITKVKEHLIPRLLRNIRLSERVDDKSTNFLAVTKYHSRKILLTFGYVSNTDFTHEWYEMMLAQGKHFNVFNNYHFVMILIKYCIFNCMFNAILVTLKYKKWKEFLWLGFLCIIIYKSLVSRYCTEISTLVKNNNAFAARSGVSSSPSLSEFSPRSCKILRYLSARIGAISARL